MKALWRMLLVFVAAAFVVTLLAYVPPTLGAFDPCPTPDAYATMIWEAAAPARAEIARRADELRARPNRPVC